MDSLVAALIGVIFGSVGAGIVWMYYKRKISYTDILKTKSVWNELIGFLVLVILGFIIYYFKTK